MAVKFFPTLLFFSFLLGNFPVKSNEEARKLVRDVKNRGRIAYSIPGEPIHPIDLTPLLSSIYQEHQGKCTFHFIEHAQIYDFSLSQGEFPVVINTIFGEHNGAMVERKKGNRFLNLRIEKVVNIYLMSPGQYKMAALNGVISDHQYLLEADMVVRGSLDLFYTVAVGQEIPPSLFKSLMLNLFIVSDHVVNQNPWSIKEVIFKTERYYEIHLPSLILLYDIGSLSMTPKIHRGLYYCPNCLEQKSIGYEFPLNCPSGQSQSQGQDPGQGQNWPACYKQIMTFYNTLKTGSSQLPVAHAVVEHTQDYLFYKLVPEVPWDLKSGKFFTPFHRYRQGHGHSHSQRAEPSPVTSKEAIKFCLYTTVNLTVEVLDEFDRRKLQLAESKTSGFVSINTLDKFALMFSRKRIYPLREEFYRFITAHEVKPLKTSLMIYKTPFQTEVWLHLAAFIAGTAIFLSFLQWNEKEVVKIGERRVYLVWNKANIWKVLLKQIFLIADGLFWMGRLFIEQGDTEAPPSAIHQQNKRDPGQSRGQPKQNAQPNEKYRLILGFWLLAFLVITNEYKGIIKSEYAVSNPYATELKKAESFLKTVFNSKFEPFTGILSNEGETKVPVSEGTAPEPDFWEKYNTSKQFSIFYTTSDFECPQLRPENRNDRFEHNIFEWQNSHDASGAPYQTILDPKETLRYSRQLKCLARCPDDKDDAHEPRNPFIRSKCTHIKICREYVKLVALFHRTWKTCIEKLEDLIKSELSASQFAVLILPDQDFASYWSIFKDMMSKNKSMFKFAHNKKPSIKDDSFKKVDTFVIFEGLDRHFPLSMTERMGRLLQSGIVGLWIKWENIRYGPPELHSKSNSTSKKDGATEGPCTKIRNFHYKEECKKAENMLKLRESRRRTRKTSFFMNLDFDDVPPFKPLSFRDSDVHLVFYVYSFFIPISFGFLLVEFFYRFLRKSSSGFYFALGHFTLFFDRAKNVWDSLCA